MRYWLFKSEPSAFSIDHLESKPGQTSPWDGVRNYQVRNFLRDQIHPGDLGFFYHSSCPLPAIVGIIEIISEGYPDFTAWDPQSPGYDPKSTADKPRWYMVDVRLKKKFTSPILLQDIKKHPILKEMVISRTGNRLSITPVTATEWQTVVNISSGEHSIKNKEKTF